MSGVQQRIADIGEHLYVRAHTTKLIPHIQMDVRDELAVRRAF